MEHLIIAGLLVIIFIRLELLRLLVKSSRAKALKQSNEIKGLQYEMMVLELYVDEIKIEKQEQAK